jgi:sirohydrochlorin cobaltochelatase
MNSELPDVPIIGLAHGSRHAEVGAALDELMSVVGTLAGVPAKAAFLDLTEPDLEHVATELAAEGFDLAVVVPLLFTAAFHATIDVPQTISSAAQATGVELIVADILGTDDDVLKLLHHSAAAADISPTSSLLLYAVGSSREAANAAVHDLAARLAAERTAPVLAAFGTCEPKPQAVLDKMPEPRAILPLFLSPGLLLDPMIDIAAERGWPIAKPLGVAAAPIIHDRYLRALSTAGLR